MTVGERESVCACHGALTTDELEQVVTRAGRGVKRESGVRFDSVARGSAIRVSTTTRPIVLLEFPRARVQRL